MIQILNIPHGSQRRILPLFLEKHLRRKLSYDEVSDIKSILEQSRCLLGSANFQFSALRRKKILVAINKDKIGLADQPLPNGKRLLFGDTFPSIAPKQADLSRHCRVVSPSNLASSPSFSIPNQNPRSILEQPELRCDYHSGLRLFGRTSLVGANIS